MATLALLVVQMLKNILQSSSADMVAAVADSGMFVPMFASALNQVSGNLLCSALSRLTPSKWQSFNCAYHALLLPKWQSSKKKKHFPCLHLFALRHRDSRSLVADLHWPALANHTPLCSLPTLHGVWLRLELG
jgi:hypothetical protein